MSQRTTFPRSSAALHDVLRAADPIRGQDTDPLAGVHLSRAAALLAQRLLVAARTMAIRPRHRRSWRRRLIAATVAAVVLPGVAVVAGPPIAARFGLSGTPFAESAVAGDGRLTCEGGDAAAIPPDSAAVRLWPTALPSGWRVTRVFARRFSGTNWCTAPSLVVVRTNATGLITGTVRLTGPVPGIKVEKGARTAPDRVWRYDAVRFRDRDDSRYHTWIVTDPTGGQWFAEVDGYRLAQARALLGAARLDGHTARWESRRTPTLRVVHRRTGPPYPTTIHDGLDWYLNLDARGTGRQLEAWGGRGGAPVASTATVGTRMIAVRGTVMLVDYVEGRPNAVYADVEPGMVAWSDVRGDLPAAEARLLSLRNLPADDPRLRRYALKEK